LDEIEQFKERHPIALMFHTTGRREDAVRLGPQHAGRPSPISPGEE